MRPVILSGSLSTGLILGPLHDIAAGTAIVGDPDKQTVVVCHGDPSLRDTLAAAVTDSRYLTVTTSLSAKTVNGAHAIPAITLLPPKVKLVAERAGEGPDAVEGAARHGEWLVKPLRDNRFPLIFVTVPDLYGSGKLDTVDETVKMRALAVKKAVVDNLDQWCNTIHILGA